MIGGFEPPDPKDIPKKDKWILTALAVAIIAIAAGICGLLLYLLYLGIRFVFGG